MRFGHKEDAERSIILCVWYPDAEAGFVIETGVRCSLSWHARQGFSNRAMSPHQHHIYEALYSRSTIRYNSDVLLFEAKVQSKAKIMLENMLDLPYSKSHQENMFKFVSRARH